MPRQKTKKRLYRKKCGGENTSPNRAAKRIQSRFRGNKDRKVAERKKELKREQKRVDDFREIVNRNLGDTENIPDEVMKLIMNHSGRGKKKKSKKITHKKSKTRSKRGG